MKRKCVVLVTDVNQPLGNMVGTGLEILEVVDLLKGAGPDDMKELVFKLGMDRASRRRCGIDAFREADD